MNQQYIIMLIEHFKTIYQSIFLNIISLYENVRKIGVRKRRFS